MLRRFRRNKRHHHNYRNFSEQEHAGKKLKNTYLIVLGILSAGMGLKGFLLPNNFIDGGVTGISLLIAQLTDFPLSVLVLIINIPFIVLAYKQVSKAFAFRTLLAIIGLSLCLYFIHYPIVTSDKLLISVFGGFFLGLGIGLSMRGGCVIDGTEVLSLYLSRKTGLSIGDIILVINVIIFSFAAITISLEAAFYSLLTYLSASKTVDFITYGFEEYLGLMIISNKSEEIRKFIIETQGRGATLFKGKRGFGRKGGQLADVDIVYSVTTKLEMAGLRNKIEKIDQSAFIIMQSIHDVRGGMLKKRPFH